MIKTEPHNTSCAAQIKPPKDLWLQLQHVRALLREPKQPESSTKCSVVRITTGCRRPIDLLSWAILRPIAPLLSTDSYDAGNYVFNEASR